MPSLMVQLIAETPPEPALEECARGLDAGFGSQPGAEEPVRALCQHLEHLLQAEAGALLESVASPLREAAAAGKGRLRAWLAKPTTRPARARPLDWALLANIDGAPDPLETQILENL